MFYVLSKNRIALAMHVRFQERKGGRPKTEKPEKAATCSTMSLSLCFGLYPVLEKFPALQVVEICDFGLDLWLRFVE